VSTVAWRTRVGVDLAQAADGSLIARAVGVRGRRAVWRRAAPLDTENPLSVALGTFLGRLPARRWPRPAVVVALGPESVQLKRLPGLPPLAEPRALTALVRENACRFFLRNGIPIVTSGLRVDGSGDAWGAAAELPLLLAIEQACRAAGVRVRAIVPSATVLGSVPTLLATPASPETDGDPHSSGTHTIVWPDGSASYELRYVGERLVGLRRRSMGAAPDGGASSTSSNDEQAFAAAHAAATAGGRQAIAWRPTASAAEPSAFRWRVRIATAACMVTIAGASISPGLASMYVGAEAARHLRAVAGRRQQAVAAGDSLRQLTATLREAAVFASRRRPATTFLAHLTDALPSGAAVVALHIDSTGGTLVSLAPNVSDLLTRLEHVPEIAGLEVVGPVTTEMIQLAPPLRPATPTDAVAPRTVMRATLRFLLASPVSASSNALEPR